MARKFLYLVAIAAVLVIAAAIVFSIWSRELTRLAMVPSAEFVEQEPLQANAYQDPELWYSRPGIGTGDPSRWQPPLRSQDGSSERQLPGPVAAPDFAVFFVHPTSYYNRAGWNAPWADEDAERTARLFLRGLASPFNQASEIWAPKYRQATMGAFLTDDPRAARALDAAYADVEQAFDFFLSSVDDDAPIVIAGHSQGALHVMRLLEARVAGTPLAERVAAAYVVGWPISQRHDLPALGLPACATPNQPGCIMSWSSFAEPADPTDVLESYAASTGLDGEKRGQSAILCTNPLSGGIAGEVSADANPGTLVPDGDVTNGELVPGYVGARCDDRGLLLIGAPPEMGNAVLPGNNYHVYDIPLFWSAVQRDVAARVEAWASSRS